MRKSVRLPRRMAITAVVAAAGTAGAVSLAGCADATTPAARQSLPASCSVATLKGTYLFQGNGWSVSRGTAKPVAFAGTDHFNGAGHVQESSTDSTNGVITRSSAYAGTYKIAANCTGTFILGNTYHFDLYTSPDGNGFTNVETDHGIASAAIEQRAARISTVDLRNKAVFCCRHA